MNKFYIIAEINISPLMCSDADEARERIKAALSKEFCIKVDNILVSTQPIHKNNNDHIPSY